jgi:hypothetical protein
MYSGVAAALAAAKPAKATIKSKSANELLQQS